MTTFFVDCWDDKTDLPSPDARHIARLLVHTCEGPLAANVNITQTIEIATVGANAARRVFENDDDNGAMHWDDNDNLSIEVGGVSTIALSLHEADGVRVTYHVPKRSMSLKISDDEERQTEELHQAGKSKD